ncbi:MAG: ATP-binding protein [Candidatus Omnitrophota bacterium]
MLQWSISNFFTCLATLFLAIFVFFSNRKSKISKIFCIYSLSIAWWSFFTAFHAYTSSRSVSLLSAKIMHISVPFIPILFFHFCLVILNSYQVHRNKLLIGYVISAILVVINIISNLIVSGVRPKLGYHYFMDGGLIYPFLILDFAIYTALGLYLFLRACFASTGNRRNQLRYLFVGSLLGYSFGVSCFFPVYNITLFPYPFGSYAISAYVFITTYAILRYRLLDIKVALTRTSIFVMVYTLVLGLPFAVSIWLKAWLVEVFGAGWWVLPQGLTALLATGGPFLYIYLDRKAENRLLKEQKRYQAILKQASAGMTRIRNLKRLLDLIAHIVTKTVKISYVGIYLFHKDTDEFILQVNRDKGRMPPIKIPPSNPLIAWLKENQEPLVYEEIKRLKEDNYDISYKELEENMRLLSGTVVIPSLLEDKLLALIVLGDKTSGQIYTPEDLNVFQVLAAQAALAIENARFFEEAKEMQEQIAQAEKMATVGTMADGMSHQINNRFYALSLIAGDTIDTIKLMDASKCTPEVKEIIDSVKHALERINDNVIQGGQVVRGLLKYSRKGDEGIEAVTLDQILDGTLEMVQFKVDLAKVDILRNYPKDTPKIKGNSVQLQEVFFNFIDNAYDAIVERKDTLKEEGFRGKIAFSVQPRDNILEITIQDNGLGIKDTDSNKVFTPFFTTKTSSRKGTGLGLYVVRRVIEEFHKGKLSFTSTYGKGTTFIVELPIAKE